MSWQECSKVDERLRFDCGLDGLTDRSRRPYRQANRLPFQIEALMSPE